MYACMYVYIHVKVYHMDSGGSNEVYVCVCVCMYVHIHMSVYHVESNGLCMYACMYIYM
jgi:hypothetical protein